MRKLNLALLAVFISLNVNAATTSTNLNTAISKGFDRDINNQGQHSTIVYGGKDISRSIVAAAHEHTWTKQSILIG